MRQGETYKEAVDRLEAELGKIEEEIRLYHAEKRRVLILDHVFSHLHETIVAAEIMAQFGLHAGLIGHCRARQQESPFIYELCEEKQIRAKDLIDFGRQIGYNPLHKHYSRRGSKLLKEKPKHTASHNGARNRVIQKEAYTVKRK